MLDRPSHELRPVSIERGYLDTTAGSVLLKAGRTVVLCTAGVSEDVPPWRVGRGSGWLTAEYNMLPGSTAPRKPRERAGKVDGRTTEIQRLIGRSLRAAIDLRALGERTITIDCDVLQADGGTRTAAITGAFVALVDAVASLDLPATPLRHSVAAVSVGVIDGQVRVDLDYALDSRADVDLNLVMTGQGEFIEVQGTGESGPFTAEQLAEMLSAGQHAIAQLTGLQQAALGSQWPWPA